MFILKSITEDNYMKKSIIKQNKSNNLDYRFYEQFLKKKMKIFEFSVF